MFGPPLLRISRNNSRAIGSSVPNSNGVYLHSEDAPTSARAPPPKARTQSSNLAMHSTPGAAPPAITGPPSMPISTPNQVVPLHPLNSSHACFNEFLNFCDLVAARNGGSETPHCSAPAAVMLSKMAENHVVLPTDFASISAISASPRVVDVLPPVAAVPAALSPASAAVLPPIAMATAAPFPLVQPPIAAATAAFLPQQPSHLFPSNYAQAPIHSSHFVSWSSSIAPQFGSHILASKVSAVVHFFQVSMLEIYNETIRDLLAPNKSSFDASRVENAGKQYVIKHDANGNTFVSDLTIIDVRNSREVSYLLERAAQSRSVGKTMMRTVI